LTLLQAIDILLIGRISIYRSTRSSLDCASEISGAAYQGKSAIQVVLAKGIGLLIAPDAAFPSERIFRKGTLNSGYKRGFSVKKSRSAQSRMRPSKGKSALSKAALHKCGEGTVFVKTIQVIAV
jgi:hypothetical protein